MSYSNSSATIETTRQDDQNGSSLEYRATVSSRRSSNQLLNESSSLSSSAQSNRGGGPAASTPQNSSAPSRPVISAGISDVIGRATGNNNNNNNNSKDCHEPAKLPDCNGAPGNPVTYLSEVEAAILRSSVPIDVNETEEITVLGQKGIWTNKAEVVNWRGLIPIAEYKINEDGSPEVITKRTDQKLTYVQELAIRYLRPPTPPPPGEILITQECNCLPPPAPPLIIRQQPCRPSTPEPLVIREAPPKPPCSVGRKVITISGKRMPPPPRKVVIERLAPLPTKPQAVLIERWLPYSQVKRRVIYQRACEQEPVAIKPKNVIVQWEAPQVVIKKDFKYLGVIRANPVEYVQRYGSSLKTSKELPDFVLEIKPPSGITLAADYQYNEVHELEGDLQALGLVDLEKEGLGEYRAQLEQKGINYVGGEAGDSSSVGGAIGQATTRGSARGSSNTPPPTPSTGVPSGGGATFTQSVISVTNRRESSTSNQSTTSSGRPRGYIRSLANNPNAAQVVADIFAKVDLDKNGKLSVEEAEKVLLKINSRLGRQYGEDDVKQFFQVLDTDKDGSIDLDEFRAAFERDL